MADFSNEMIAHILAQAQQDPNNALSHSVQSLPTPAASTPAAESTLSKILKAIDVGAIGSDAATTTYALTHGYREGDPLLNWAPKQDVVPLMLGLDAGSYLLAKKVLGDKHPALMQLFTAAQAANHGIASGHNLKLFNSGKD